MSPRLLRAAGGQVAVLPAPRRQRQARLLPLLVMLLVFGAALLASSGRMTVNSGGAQPTPATSLVLRA